MRPIKWRMFETCFAAEKPGREAPFDPLQVFSWRGLRCLLGVDLSCKSLGSRLTSRACHLSLRRSRGCNCEIEEQNTLEQDGEVRRRSPESQHPGLP